MSTAKTGCAATLGMNSVLISLPVNDKATPPTAINEEVEDGKVGARSHTDPQWIWNRWLNNCTDGLLVYSGASIYEIARVGKSSWFLSNEHGSPAKLFISPDKVIQMVSPVNKLIQYHVDKTNQNGRIKEQTLYSDEIVKTRLN